MTETKTDAAPAVSAAQGSQPAAEAEATAASAAGAASAPAEGDESGPGAADRMHQADGRYIPYSGGSLGWYENSGLLAYEKQNNYLFHTAMDANVVRAKQYLRAGLRAEKRRSGRRTPADEMSVTIKAEGTERKMRLIDISKHGAKVQLASEELVMKNSDKVLCQFNAPGSTAPALELTCTVVRTEKTGRTRTLWNFGLDFPMLALEELEKLNEIAHAAQAAAKA